MTHPAAPRPQPRITNQRKELHTMNDFIDITVGDRIEVNENASASFRGARGTVVGIEERPFELGPERVYQVQMDDQEPGIIHLWAERYIDYVSELQDDAGLPEDDDEDVCADPRCCPQPEDDEDGDPALAMVRALLGLDDEEPEPELLIDMARVQALQAAYEVLGGENVHVADVTIAAHFLLGECC